MLMLGSNTFNCLQLPDSENYLALHNIHYKLEEVWPSDGLQGPREDAVRGHDKEKMTE